MPLRQQLSDALSHIQGHLFPMLRAEVGPLTGEHERLVTVLGMVRVEAFVRLCEGGPGRPREDRHALARAFIAKAVLNLPESRMLLEPLAVDRTLRRLCGWERARQVPCEATFSRAFAEFAEGAVATLMHAALVRGRSGRRFKARSGQVKACAPRGNPSSLSADHDGHQICRRIERTRESPPRSRLE